MKSLSDTFTLLNGVKIPCVGFGTWRTPDGEVAVSSVKEALKVGYRHIDTAAAYKNEGSVGKAIKEAGIPREEIFVTSKLWNSEHGYETTLKAFEKTMEELGLDYLDLYLIHWPVPKIHREDWKEATLSTWRAFEKLYKEGKIKAIGVSNFKVHHLQHIIDNCEIKPMVNQIEFHPSCLREDIVDFCRENNILVEAWSPLASGEVFKVEELKTIAEKYNKNVAQLVIRWVLQKEILPLPKSVHSDRIKDNGDIFDFEISKEDMQLIDGITSCKGSGNDPDFIEF
ncbi:MAG: aldo/keto reductase [Clostridiaceae bacterium]